MDKFKPGDRVRYASGKYSNLQDSQIIHSRRNDVEYEAYYYADEYGAKARFGSWDYASDLVLVQDTTVPKFKPGDKVTFASSFTPSRVYTVDKVMEPGDNFYIEYNPKTRYLLDNGVSWDYEDVMTLATPEVNLDDLKFSVEASRMIPEHREYVMRLIEDVQNR